LVAAYVSVETARVIGAQGRLVDLSKDGFRGRVEKGDADLVQYRLDLRRGGRRGEHEGDEPGFDAPPAGSIADRRIEGVDAE
jgi:hypothetical protein